MAREAFDGAEKKGPCSGGDEGHGEAVPCGGEPCAHQAERPRDEASAFPPRIEGAFAEGSRWARCLERTEAGCPTRGTRRPRRFYGACRARCGVRRSAGACLMRRRRSMNVET